MPCLYDAIHDAEDRVYGGSISGELVIRDDAEASVLRLELESGRTEWVVFNPQTETIRAAGIEMNEPLAYIDAGRR